MLSHTTHGPLSHLKTRIYSHSHSFTHTHTICCALVATTLRASVQVSLHLLWCGATSPLKGRVHALALSRTDQLLCRLNLCAVKLQAANTSASQNQLLFPLQCAASSLTSVKVLRLTYMRINRWFQWQGRHCQCHTLVYYEKSVGLTSTSIEHHCGQLCRRAEQAIQALYSLPLTNFDSLMQQPWRITHHLGEFRWRSTLCISW